MVKYEMSGELKHFHSLPRILHYPTYMNASIYMTFITILTQFGQTFFAECDYDLKLFFFFFLSVIVTLNAGIQFEK